MGRGKTDTTEGVAKKATEVCPCCGKTYLAVLKLMITGPGLRVTFRDAPLGYGVQGDANSRLCSHACAVARYREREPGANDIYAAMNVYALLGNALLEDQMLKRMRKRPSLRLRRLKAWAVGVWRAVWAGQ